LAAVDALDAAGGRCKDKSKSKGKSNSRFFPFVPQGQNDNQKNKGKDNCKSEGRPGGRPLMLA
jgi:hypothetical protein